MNQQITRDVRAKRNNGVFDEARVEVDAGGVCRGVGMHSRQW
jgi:hypothetical protein